MPRAYDRLVPPVDKDPNRFGTDYSDPLSAVSDAAAVAGEQIRDQLVQIIMDKTGIDLSGPVAFIDWLGKQINVALGDLAATLAGIVAPLFQTIEQLLDLIKAAIGVDLRTVVANLQALIDGLFGLFGGAGAGKTVAEALAAISDWLGKTFKGVSDGLAAVVKTVNDLIAGFFSLFGGTGTASLAGMFSSATNWMTVTFKGVSDGLAAVVKTVTDLIDGFFKLFGGTGTVSLTTMLTVATAWMAQWQAFLDGVWNAFTGGVAGAGKTVAEALKSVTDWLSNIFQALLDDIAKLLPFNLGGWTPGTAAADLHATVQNAVNTLAAILGIGKAAGVSAANANAGLAALMAGQAGGFFDEFEYQIATNLPAADWKKTSSLADSYGPDGSGSAVFNASGGGNGWVEYVQISKPLSVPDMKCGVTLSKLPTWNTISVGGLHQSSWRIKVQCNPTSQECLGVEIANNQARFYSMNATGTVATLGAWKAIPNPALGVQYTLEIKGNVLTLYRGGIVAATHSGVTPLTGRCVGFGAEKIVYIGGHPCINLAGVSWQPAT